SRRAGCSRGNHTRALDDNNIDNPLAPSLKRVPNGWILFCFTNVPIIVNVHDERIERAWRLEIQSQIVRYLCFKYIYVTRSTQNFNLDNKPQGGYCKIKPSLP